MTIISIPTHLKERLGEAATYELVGMMNQLEDNTIARAITTVEEKFERRLAEEVAKLIKWMFIFWIGQAATVVGIVKVMR